MVGFPEIIHRLPVADSPIRGATLYLLQGPSASATFVEAVEDGIVPEHRRGAQWGFIVDGELHLTIGGTLKSYRRGEEYFVPAGVPHSASFKKGLRVIDFFDDPNRYHPKR